MIRTLITRPTARRVAHASLVAILAVGLMAGTVAAAKPSGAGKPGGGGTTSGTGTISLATPLVFDANANGVPNHADVVTFAISTSASAPFVNLVCTQNGMVVLNGSHGFFDGALDTSRNFGLASGAWQGGDAQCTAYLQVQTKRGWSRLASTSFAVSG